MILMIYNKNMCREILLPNLINSDYNVVISGNEYGFESEIVLSMEVTDTDWRILKNSKYTFQKNGDICKECKIADGDIIGLETVSGEALRIIVIDNKLAFLITDKYDLRQKNFISIGKAGDNIICYNFRNLISGYHAELIKKSDGWYIVDKSSNGIFDKNGRINERHKLVFSEHINLFGLHIIFLGDILAVGSYYGEYTVNRRALNKATISFPKPYHSSLNKTEEKFFNRSPRDLPSLYTEEMVIEDVPARKNTKQRPMLLTIGPSFTMAIPMLLGCSVAIMGSRISGGASSAFMYTGIITAIGSSVFGAFWAMKNMKYNKKEEALEEKKRFEKYGAYLTEKTEELKKQYEYNTQAMRETYPPAGICVNYGQENTQLWNRNRTHYDFLFHRIGVGDIKFQVEVKIPQKKFTLENDILSNKPELIANQFKNLHHIPIGVSFLENQLIGLIGGKNKVGAYELMHAIVADIAASHCYTDVKFIFLYDEKNSADRMEWECMSWFPHVWSEDRQMRYMAADEVERRDVLFALSNVLRARLQEMTGKRREKIPKPYYLIFVSDPELLEGELLTQYLYEPLREYGITTFLLAENISQLPNNCEDIIENSQEFQGYYNLLQGIKGKKEVLLDKVRKSDLEKMGRRLANIRVNEIETTSEIPQSLDFFSMYNVRKLDEFKIEERWRKNRTYNSMKALIGKKSGNADCYLDVHEKYHGPHGLVAGTTGSGKSETLQTYILSLALNYSPEDVAFFIIDFKGGGMANLFSSLPHMAGKISNLSGNQIHRAMISIKSENLRRQQIFTEYGVNNINLYTRLYKNNEAKEAVPHLFIIIDEFAELKKEEPDFMRELISVAQVGRSLGVHLILATQKPSGTVDDNIWSNSRFRLCLRVQDRQDSNDMLHKPDAAFITQTGRGYLQVGNDELYEMFQSGWSGAPYEENEEEVEASVALITRTGRESLTSSRLKRLRKEVKNSNFDEKQKENKKKDKTQLDAVVEYLEKKSEEMGYCKARQLWLPVLGTEIYLQDLEKNVHPNTKEKWSLRAEVGLYDDPEGQQQKTLEVDFAENGNMAVCGSVVSGKSTFLQTLLYSLLEKYSPNELQCYVIDFSSRMLAAFSQAPNTGGIVYDDQEDRLAKFMYLLESMMEERRKLFQGGNYSQYVQAYGQKIPAVLVVIDNFSSFREKTGMKYDDIILKYVREGTGYGMFLVLTAAGYGISEIPNRIADNIRTVIALEQSDKFKYMEVLRMTKLQVLPEAGIKGRGLAEVNGKILEFQTALSIQTEDDFERGRILEEYYSEKSKLWEGKRPLPIPEIPENPTLGQLEKTNSYKKMASYGEKIPFAYKLDTAEIFGVSLRDTYCYTISGKAHTGKTNALKLLLYGATQMNGKVYVIEPELSELKKAASECQAKYMTSVQEVFEFFKELTPVFVKRNKKKRGLIDEGKDEQEIYSKMQEDYPIYIFLSDLNAFFKMIYHADSIVGNMSGFMETIMEKGRLHRIYFFGCLKVEDMISLMSYKAYKSYVSYRKGIHLGGNLNSQKVFSFQNVSYTELGKTMKKGRAYAADEEDETIGHQIVVPLARRE